MADLVTSEGGGEGLPGGQDVLPSSPLSWAAQGKCSGPSWVVVLAATG